MDARYVRGAQFSALAMDAMAARTIPTTFIVDLVGEDCKERRDEEETSKGLDWVGSPANAGLMS